MKKKSNIPVAPGHVKVRVSIHSNGGEFAGNLVVSEARARAFQTKGAFKAGRLLEPHQLDSLKISYDTSISIEAV